MTTLRSFLIPILTSVALYPCQGQWELYFDGTVPVIHDGEPLALAWAGGLNSVQVSPLDLNNDGLDDLVLFDRSGNTLITLLNDGIPNTVSYTHTRDFDGVAPFMDLHDWALFRDYDMDGRADLFAYSQAGFAVYRNTSSGSMVSFELITNQVRSNYVSSNGNPVYANLFISQVDLPGIADIDSDGDLDVLVFSLLGSYVEYHKNLSMELYGHADSLTFELRNRCWGYFSESASDNSVTLNVPCNFNVPNPEVGGGGSEQSLIRHGKDGVPKSHSGSCITPLDLNGDGVMDILLGDVSFNNVVALTNGGTVDLGMMSSVDNYFPIYDESVDLAIFPASFYVDLNNDGKRDLVVSPNGTSLAENRNSMWHYRNNGTDASPEFSFLEDNVFQGSMIDLGEGAYPVPFDHDGDGLMDLVVANHGHFQTGDTYVCKLMLLRNDGTGSNPSFEVVDEDFAGLSTSGIGLSMYPAFADMDDDGDKDMYIGDLQGRLHFFRNIGSAQSPDMVLEMPNMTDAFGTVIDVGQFATPQFFDLDGDSLLDLLIGERNGNLNYYRNIGTAEQASWQLISGSLGDVSTVEWWNITGHSVPFMFLNEAGEKEILLGSESGWLYHYGDIDGNELGTYTLLDSTFLGVREGIRTAPCMHDLTGDGELDLVVGNYRGGLSFWRSDMISSTGAREPNVVRAFNILPNPTNGEVVLSLSNPVGGDAIWVIRDGMGRTVHTEAVTGMNTVLSLQGLARGVYYVRTEGALNLPAQRLILIGRDQ